MSYTNLVKIPVFVQFLLKLNWNVRERYEILKSTEKWSQSVFSKCVLQAVVVGRALKEERVYLILKMKKVNALYLYIQ